MGGAPVRHYEHGRHSPQHDWLPRHDRLIRAMWPDPWQWSLEDVAEGVGLDRGNKHMVTRRALQLGLGRRPAKTFGRGGPKYDWAQLSLAELQEQQRRARCDRLRRLRVRHLVGPAVVAGPSAGFACPGRQLAPDVRALVDAALAARSP